MKIALLMLGAALQGQASTGPVFVECRSMSAPTMIWKLGVNPTTMSFWQASSATWQTYCYNDRYTCSYQNGEWKQEWIGGRYKEYYAQMIISRNTGKGMNVSSGTATTRSFTNYYVCAPTADPAVSAKPAF